MALNLDSLKDYQKELEERSSNTGGSFFYAKSIGEQTDVRLLPPLPHQNGVYFFEVIKFWINGKAYVSPATFGKFCPLQEELDQAEKLAKSDPTIKQLIEKGKFTKKSEFHLPMLLLEIKEDDHGNVTGINVVDEKPKVLVAGVMLIKAINKIVTSRNYQNGTEDGLMDRVKGWNLTLSKTGKDLGTEYGALGWSRQTEMPEKYYKEIPDVAQLAKSELKSDDYLRGVARNYLYGESLPADESKANHTKPEQQAEIPTSGGVRRGAPKADAKAEDEAPAARPKATGRRNLVDDMENMG